MASTAGDPGGRQEPGASSGSLIQVTANQMLGSSLVVFSEALTVSQIRSKVPRTGISTPV